MNARALVARNIRRLRVIRLISQEALAVDAGIDRTYVSRLERGLENPTVAILEQISAALQVEITELFVVPKPDEFGGRRFAENEPTQAAPRGTWRLERC
jgi:transcriptional regulator with XRE-family HTH domain